MRARLGLLLLLTAAFACSTTMDATPPAGFDLNGRWQVDASASDAPPDREQLFDEPMPDSRSVARNRGTPVAFDPADFPVLVAQAMSIEQDRQSMGIDYQGFGYRDITFGERRSSGWEVEAGWDEARDLVVSMKRNRVRYRERYLLSPDGRRLTVIATVATRQGDRTVTRVFDRAPAAE